MLLFFVILNIFHLFFCRKLLGDHATKCWLNYIATEERKKGEMYQSAASNKVNEMKLVFYWLCFNPKLYFLYSVSHHHVYIYLLKIV